MKRVLGAVLALIIIMTSLPAAFAAGTSASSAILMEADSGRVLYEQNAHEPRLIASITKLMTALVALESGQDLGEEVTIRPEWAGAEGSSIYLQPGEKVSLETLLYGLLLHSGNDAAVALAAHCAGDVETFVGWMNQRARDLGMTGTHFSDPNGLGDEDHYSTALDMARLGAACLKNPVVSKIVATKSIVLEGRSFTNHNKLLWQYEGCTGMKTGYTRQAGRTLVSSAERDGQKLVCVTLSDGNDWADHKTLLDYGFETYPRQVLAEEGGTLRRMTVEESLLRQVPVVARDTVAYPLKEGEQITAKIQLPKTARAPVTQGEIAGTVTFYKGERQVGRTYLVWGKSAGQDVISQDSPRSPLGMLKRWTGEESTA